LSAPRFAFRLRRSSGAVAAGLALAFAFAQACSPDVPPAENESGGASGASGATTGGAGGVSGGSGGAGGSGGSGGVGGATAGAGGAAGVGGAAGLVGGASAGGASGAGGMPGGTAGTAGQAIGGAGSGGAVQTGGAAGTTAMGGASGSAGDAGSAGSGGSMPAMGFLSEDFEAGTKGQGPAGWDTFIAYVKNGQNPSGETLALVDDTRAHSGTKSVHFKGGSSPAMITRPLPMGTNTLYVRAWVYMTRQLGNAAMQTNANHETLIGIRAVSGSASDEVRFGEIKGVIGTSMPAIGDAISPAMASWYSGPSVAANTWACIEVAFLAASEPHTLHAWADGTLVHEITSVGPDQWENKTLPANWMAGRFTEVIMGWQSFTPFDIDVWMDDVVLGESRIGCAP
jgi:hypothetical protein